MVKLGGRLSVLVSLLLLALLGACTTTYRFSSTPDGAAVYHKTPTDRVLLGQTPIDYAKTALPSDAPFVIEFDHDGYEPKDIAVTPTDNSLTTVAVQLKPLEPGGRDTGLIRVRRVLGDVFKIQELIYGKHYVEALSMLKDLEAAEGKLAEVFVLRGSVYALLGDQEQTRREWQRALTLDPTLEELKVRMAQLQGSTEAKKP
jgi:tetratricopeptide (TPR) repeat protein